MACIESSCNILGPPPAYSEDDVREDYVRDGKQPRCDSLPPSYEEYLRSGGVRTWSVTLGKVVYCITETDVKSNGTVVVVDYSGSMSEYYNNNDRIVLVGLRAGCTVLAFSSEVAEMQLTEEGGVTGAERIRGVGTDFNKALAAAQQKIRDLLREQRQLLFITDGRADLSPSSKVFLDSCATVTVVYFGDQVDITMLQSCVRGSCYVGQLPAGVQCTNKDGTLFSVQGQLGEALEVAVRQLLGRSVRSVVVDGAPGAGLQTHTFAHRVSELSSSGVPYANTSNIPVDERASVVAALVEYIRHAGYPPSIQWARTSDLAKLCHEWFQGCQLFGSDQLFAALRRLGTATTDKALTRLFTELGTVTNMFAVNNVPSRLEQKAFAKLNAFAQQTLECRQKALRIVETHGGFPQGRCAVLIFKGFAVSIPTSLTLNPGSVTPVLEWTPNTTPGFILPLVPGDATKQLALVDLALIASTRGMVPCTAKLRQASLCNALVYADPRVVPEQFAALARVAFASLEVDLRSQVWDLKNDDSDHPLYLAGLDGEHPAANSLAVSLLGTRFLSGRSQSAAILALAWNRYGKLRESQLLAYSACPKVSSFVAALTSYRGKPLEVEVRYSVRVDAATSDPMEQSGSNPPFPTRAQVERVLPLCGLRWSDVEAAATCVLAAHGEMGSTSQSTLSRTDVYKLLDDYSAKLVPGGLRFTVPSATATQLYRAFQGHHLPPEPLSVVLDLLAGLEEAYAGELVDRVWDKNPRVEQVKECCSRALALFLKYAPWELARSAPVPWVRVLGAPPGLLASLPSAPLHTLVQRVLESAPQERSAAQSLLAVVRAVPECGSYLEEYKLDESKFCHELVTNWPLRCTNLPRILPLEHALSEEVWCLCTARRLQEGKDGGGEANEETDDAARTNVLKILARPAPLRPLNVRLFKPLFPDLFEVEVPLDVLQTLLLSLGMKRLVGLNHGVPSANFLWNQYSAEERENELRTYWQTVGGRVNQHDEGLQEKWFERALPVLRCTTLEIKDWHKVKGNKPNGALELIHS
jgi:hypothetical protein